MLISGYVFTTFFVILALTVYRVYNRDLAYKQQIISLILISGFPLAISFYLKLIILLTSMAIHLIVVLGLLVVANTFALLTYYYFKPDAISSFLFPTPEDFDALSCFVILLNIHFIFFL